MSAGSVVDRTELFQDIDEDLKSTIAFLYEASHLKGVIRQTYLPEYSRYENSAEHSWNLILMALALYKTANEPVNLERVLSMLAIHDLGEIGGGDTFYYDAARADAAFKERNYVSSLFSNLDDATAKKFMELWDEFENGQSTEAKFARALDRFQPFLSNLHNGGESWKRNKITLEKALSKNQHISAGSNSLWRAYQILANKAKAYFFSDAVV